MNFDDLALITKARSEDLLRDAQQQRLVHEAQPAVSQPIVSQLLRVVLAILLIRPF